MAKLVQIVSKFGVLAEDGPERLAAEQLGVTNRLGWPLSKGEAKQLRRRIESLGKKIRAKTRR